MLPVLTLMGPDADEQSTKDFCPACGTADGIRFLGSAVATQLSVTLSNLFGDKNLDPSEKKALMFTDSVQDAAHRAGFVQARSHSLSLRTALRGAIGDGDGELDLTEVTQTVISRAGNDPVLRYQLLPPDIVDRDEFVGFWKSNVHPSTRRAAENKAKRPTAVRRRPRVRSAIANRSHIGTDWQRRRGGVPRCAAPRGDNRATCGRQGRPSNSR